jgi:hypothetical protein
VIDSEPFSDVLGGVHMDLVSCYQQKGNGEFFTPYPVCQEMAMMAIGDVELPTGRLIRIGNPAVDAGAQLLATAGHFCHIHGPEALAWVSLTGVDIDRHCARMFPCQVLSSLHVCRLQLGELVSYHGNALVAPTDWNTICHYSRTDLAFPVAPADHPVVKQSIAEYFKSVSSGDLGDQLTLF